MIDFKEVAIGEITPDPNQPRRIYDEAAMQELTASVKEKGVLQPILLRAIGCSSAYAAKDPAAPLSAEMRREVGYTGPVYLVVCGERRYRASIAAELPTIPAIVRILTDEEALELQIVENLQRKDVHPMEEAVAFKSLIDKGKDVKEIAVRVGKSEYYARQRIKLCDLIEDWQKAFFSGRVLHKVALVLAAFDKGVQADIWKEQGRGDGLIEFNNWYLSRYSGLLSKAPFELTDQRLIKKAGACTTCPFNSAVQSLFPEAEKQPRCNKITCFKEKTERHLEISIKKAKDEPGVVFVNTEYSGYGDNLTRQIEKEGFTYLNGTGYGNFTLVEAPVPPDLAEYDIDDYDSEEKMLEAFNAEQAAYEKDFQKYTDKVSGGKYKRGLVIHGDDKGQIVYLTIGKASSSKTTAQKTKEKEKAGKLTADDIDAEIARIYELENRKKELDLNKVHHETLKALDACKPIHEPGFAHQNLPDRAIMIFCLLQLAGYGAQNTINKKLKTLPKEPKPRAGYSLEYFEKLAEVSDDDLAFIVRTIAIDKWGSVNMQGDVHFNDTVIWIMARYAGIDLKALEAAQAEIANKRIARVDARIAELQRKKAELKPKAAKTAKKK